MALSRQFGSSDGRCPTPSVAHVLPNREGHWREGGAPEERTDTARRSPVRVRVLVRVVPFCTPAPPKPQLLSSGWVRCGAHRGFPAPAARVGAVGGCLDRRLNLYWRRNPHRRPMKKATVVGGNEQPEHRAEDRRLSLVEMEDELERCECPWRCPEACSGARVGCLRRRRKNNGNEI